MVGLTNNLHRLDDAILSRFSGGTQLVPLPSKESLKLVLGKMLAKQETLTAYTFTAITDAKVDQVAGELHHRGCDYRHTDQFVKGLVRGMNGALPGEQPCNQLCDEVLEICKEQWKDVSACLSRRN